MLKDGVYMFVNSSLFLIKVDKKKKIIDIEAPDYLELWINLDFDKFLSASIYLGEL